MRTPPLALLLGCCCYQVASADEAPPLVEPFPLLHGDDPQGAPPVPASPDPLVGTTWSAATNISGLQRYELTSPQSWLASPPSAFSGLDSLRTDSPSVTVHAPGTLRLDFGREHAAWFEFTSADLGAQAGAVRASISEYNEPWPGKTQAPKAYSGGAYRLETNRQLYEGVRYAWIIFAPQNQDPPTCVANGKEDSDVVVSCPAGPNGQPNHIKAVKFAEFGTAEGDCRAGFTAGGCAVDLAGNLSAACVQKQKCTIHCIMGTCRINGGEGFSIGGDPCPGTPKKVSAQVECEHAGAAAAPHTTPWHLTGVKLVAQSKPANYSGRFNASDPALQQAWYSGAYGSRLNMMPCECFPSPQVHTSHGLPLRVSQSLIAQHGVRAVLDGFNSILMDRGDRVSIQGDGHPTMAVRRPLRPCRRPF
jgi:hypothetical protein